MLLISSFFIMFFCIYAPVIVKIQVHHREEWQISIKMQYLFLQKKQEVNEHVFLEKEKKEDNHSLKIPIKTILADTKEIYHYIQGKYFIQSCSINCLAGFSRPDFTAYSYGLIWAVLSVLPPAWQEWLTIDYQPNFQEKMLRIAIDGIIYIPLGYLILILMHILKLVLKEWVNNENRLCGQFNGCGNGEYSANG